MRHAIDQGYDWVLNMDADFSHHPRHLPALLACRDEPASGRGVDVMIGSRYVPGGHIEGWGWKRHFMSRAVNTAARCCWASNPEIAAARTAVTALGYWPISISARFVRAAIRFRRKSCFFSPGRVPRSRKHRSRSSTGSAANRKSIAAKLWLPAAFWSNLGWDAAAERLPRIHVTRMDEPSGAAL